MPDFFDLDFVDETNDFNHDYWVSLGDCANKITQKIDIYKLIILMDMIEGNDLYDV